MEITFKVCKCILLNKCVLLKQNHNMQDPHKLNSHNNQEGAPVRNKTHPEKKHGRGSILNNVQFNTYYISVITSDR
jgi:hypothetical protein